MSRMEVASYPFSVNSFMAVSRISCRRTSGAFDTRMDRSPSLAESITRR